MAGRLDGAIRDEHAILLRQGLAAIASGGLLLVGVVLLLRQSSAMLAAPTPAVVLVAGTAAWMLVFLADTALTATTSWLVPVAARIGLLATVGALVAAPRASGTADWLARGVVVLAAALTLFRRPRRTVDRPSARPREQARFELRGPARTRGERRPAGALRQRLERFEREDGTDALRGTVVVAIPAGAKTGFGHVGFCPSFAALPTVHVSTRYDGADATVTVAEILPWGVRIECRLADPAEEAVEIPVTVSASLAPAPAPLP